MRRYSNLTSYSLIELIFVVAIIAIIGVNAVSKFIEHSSFKKAVFIKEVKNALLYVQNLAMNSGCDVAVMVSVDAVDFNYRQNCTSGLFNQAILDPNNISNTFDLNAPDGVTISSINFPVYFDTIGLARKVSDNSIVDAIINISGKTIIITGNTGFIGE